MHILITFFFLFSFCLCPSHENRFLQVMVTIDDVQGPKMSKGVVLALLSAFFYASYLVLVKRKSDTEEKINIPLFFGKSVIYKLHLFIECIHLFVWRSQFAIHFLFSLFFFLQDLLVCGICF